MSTDLARVRELVRGERGLAVVSTLRSDGSVHNAVVNAGVTTQPLTGEEVVGYVALGRALKLRHLRARPRATLTWRVGFRWQSVEGAVTLIGPDDPLEGFDPADLPQLLRDVYLSTGATHDDWPTFDRVMVEERRCVVLVSPERVYGVG
ncbi:MAG: class probable F420-dependent enzyme [Chloroflexi bacterium]|nr:class probable F420-dependent enzyme [Chloroflexota bacterium]